MTSIFDIDPIHPIWRNILAFLGLRLDGDAISTWEGVARMPAWDSPDGDEAFELAGRAAQAAEHVGHTWGRSWSRWGLEFASQKEWETANEAESPTNHFPPTEGEFLIFWAEDGKMAIVVLEDGSFIELRRVVSEEAGVSTLVAACGVRRDWTGEVLVADGNYILLTSEEGWAVSPCMAAHNTPLVLFELTGMELVEQEKRLAEVLERARHYGVIVGHYADLPPDTYARQVGALGWAVQPANRALGPFFSSLPEEIRDPLGYRTPEGITALFEFIGLSNDLEGGGLYEDVIPTFVALVSGFVSDVRGFA